MGEIRSTLDIIMEKTKGLTMTEEEKRDLKRREIAGKVRGLIQRYVDGIIDPDRLKSEAAAAGEGEKDMFRRAMIEESMDWIAPRQDNEAVLRILENATGVNIKPIRKVLADFESRMDEEKNAREKALMTRLKEKGISGSAVIPNIEADLEWKHYLDDIREEFLKKLKEALRQFVPD
jgi:uncharacterized protein YnzC (UPF0291/DUF896 family)